MRNFEITVSVPSYHPIKRRMVKQRLTGDFQSNTRLQAERDAKEWYAQEAGVMPKDIRIVTVNETTGTK